MDLTQFGKSISELSIEELHERLREIRHSRRNTTDATKRARATPKVAGKKSTKPAKEVEAILKQFTPGQLADFMKKLEDK